MKKIEFLVKDRAIFVGKDQAMTAEGRASIERQRLLVEMEDLQEIAEQVEAARAVAQDKVDLIDRIGMGC